MKGGFNIRPGRDLHRRAVVSARVRDTNLNTVVSDALRSYLEREGGVAQDRSPRLEAHR